MPRLGKPDWIEVDDTYLDDRKTTFIGRGKKRQRVPIPGTEPTQGWLFVNDCWQRPRGVKRRRRVVQLDCKNDEHLGELIVEYLSQPNVYLGEKGVSASAGESLAKP